MSDTRMQDASPPKQKNSRETSKQSSQTSSAAQVPPLEKEQIFLLYYVPSADSVFTEDPLKVRQALTPYSGKDRHIHLILHTLGGDPYSAAKIVYLLHQKCSKLTIAVPYWSMSAGTLIALGGNEIVMFDTGQLGPLDMQVQHPVVEKNISAYDYFASASYLSSIVNTAASRFYSKIREESRKKVGTSEAMEIAYKNAVNLFSPVISQLDPVELNKCYRILDVSQRYGHTFLINYSLKKEFRNERYADVLIGHLTYGYPDHSFGIFRDEADGFGLNVINSEDYAYKNQVWKLMESLLEKDVTLTSSVDNGKMIKVINIADYD